MMNLRPAIVLGIIVVLLAISPHTKADTSHERMIERVERDKRVQIAYHQCVSKVNHKFNPKSDDGILQIMRCRELAITKTQ